MSKIYSFQCITSKSLKIIFHLSNLKILVIKLWVNNMGKSQFYFVKFVWHYYILFFFFPISLSLQFFTFVTMLLLPPLLWNYNALLFLTLPSSSSFQLSLFPYCCHTTNKQSIKVANTKQNYIFSTDSLFIL